MKRFLRVSVRVWLWVNGPAVAILVAFQAFGAPYSLRVLVWLMFLVLWPGIWIWDALERWIGWWDTPWYWVLGFPAGVAAVNLCCYVAVGALMSVLERVLAWHIDRRQPHAPMSLFSGER